MQASAAAKPASLTAQQTHLIFVEGLNIIVASFFQTAFAISAMLILLQSLPAPAISQEAPIPLFQGMEYGQARQRLVNAGWQAYTAGGADMLFLMGEWSSESRSMQAWLRQDFRLKGWYETLHCYPMGSGACYHLFFHSTGKKMIVETIENNKSGENSVRHWHECLHANNDFLIEACGTPVN